MIIAAPLVIAAHVETLPTLPGWETVNVFEGAFTRRDDQRRWATIGYVPGDDGPAINLSPVSDGQNRNREEGSVGCSLVVAAADIPAARGAVFDLLSAWAQWLATDRTLAGTSGQARVLAGSTAGLSVDVTLNPTRAGATASAVVTVTYTATTYG